MDKCLHTEDNRDIMKFSPARAPDQETLRYSMGNLHPRNFTGTNLNVGNRKNTDAGSFLSLVPVRVDLPPNSHCFSSRQAQFAITAVQPC